MVKEEWREFHLRKEIIKQNGGPDIELVFHENENGVIERHKYQGPLEDGLHLTMFGPFPLQPPSSLSTTWLAG